MANHRPVSAKGEVLGRLASNLAKAVHQIGNTSLAGNQRQIVVGSVEHAKLSGNKLHSKVYFRHSGFPGGLKQTKLSQIMKSKPSWALLKAVSGMLPKNKLKSKRLRALRIA